MDLFRLSNPSQAVQKPSQHKTHTQAKPYILKQFLEKISRPRQRKQYAGGLDQRNARLGHEEEATSLLTPRTVIPTREPTPTATSPLGTVDETRHASYDT